MLYLLLFQKISRTKADIEGRKADLKEHERFISHQIDNNQETQQEIDVLNEEIANLRKQQLKSNDGYLLKTNEQITLKRMMANQASLLQQTRQRSRQLIIDKESTLQSIEKLTKIVDELAEKQKTLCGKCDGAQSRLNHLTELAEAEQKAVHGVDLEIGRLSHMLYRSQHILQQWHDDERSLKVFSSVTRALLRSNCSPHRPIFKCSSRRLMR